MNSRQYALAMKKLKVSHEELSFLIGRDVRTSMRYKAGSQKIPKIVSVLLGIMLTYQIKPEDVELATYNTFGDLDEERTGLQESRRA